MNPNIKASDQARIVGVIDPDATAAGAVSTGWIAAADFANFEAIAMAGTLGTNATFDAKLEQATNSSGAGVKDISGKAITQLTQAGTDESDQQAVINLRPDELDTTNSFTHFRLTITVGTATSDAGGIVIATDPRYSNVADATTVAEIVD